MVIGARAEIAAHTTLVAYDGATIEVAHDVFIGGLCLIAAHRSITIGPETMIAESDFSLFPVSAAFSSAGRLLLLWGMTQSTPPYPLDLHAGLFNPKGAPLGTAFSPASAASGPFIEPFCGRVAWAGDSWLITWASEMGDSEPSAVFSRRFR